MKIPKGMGYYIKYLNNILKCMDTSMIDGYSKKVLSESSSLIDIMSVASDIDDLSFLESIFTAGSDTSLFFNSFDFMKDSLYSSNKERIENSIRDVELRNKVVSRCGDLLDDDIEIVDLDGGYDVSSFDDDDGVSIVALEDSESFKGTVDSVSKSMEFSFDDEDDEDVFDEEYDEEEDSSIYDVDDSEFDEDEDYVDIEDSEVLNEDSEDSVDSIYDAAFSDDYEDDDEDNDDSGVESEEKEDDSIIDSVYDSAFDDLDDDEDDVDSFSIDDAFFDSLSIEESTDEDSEDDFESDLSTDSAVNESDSFDSDFEEGRGISGETVEKESVKIENVDLSGEMINTFADNEPKQVDDDLFSLEPEKPVSKKSLNFVDNSSAKQDESFDFSSFDDFEEEDESSELFPEDAFEEDDTFESISESSDFESLVSDSIEDSDLSEFGESGFEGDSFSDNDYEQGASSFVEPPIQRTFDDSLADGIVKFAELFNKDRRSQMARKMKSFIEDHRVTAEDEEDN